MFDDYYHMVCTQSPLDLTVMMIKMITVITTHLSMESLHRSGTTYRDLKWSWSSLEAYNTRVGRSQQHLDRWGRHNKIEPCLLDTNPRKDPSYSLLYESKRLVASLWLNYKACLASHSSARDENKSKSVRGKHLALETHQLL